MLHKAKVDSVAALANCTANEVETILHNAAPFESKKQGRIINASIAFYEFKSCCVVVVVVVVVGMTLCKNSQIRINNQMAHLVQKYTLVNKPNIT